eukprot:7315731-Pyramimonas_sp.AAC.1
METTSLATPKMMGPLEPHGVRLVSPTPRNVGPSPRGKGNILIVNEGRGETRGLMSLLHSGPGG